MIIGLIMIAGWAIGYRGTGLALEQRAHKQDVRLIRELRER